MLELINELKNTTSTNEKIKLLEKNNSDLVREIFEYTYNPFKNYYIKKIKIDYIGRKTLNSNTWHDVKKHLDRLNSREITGNSAIDLTINLIEEFDEESQELLINIIKRDLRVNISERIINKAFPNLIPDYRIQLANTYDQTKEYGVKNWYVTPKLDGLRCTFIEGKLLTRNGKEIIGFDHIIEELKRFPNNTSLIDGELYNHDIKFQTIQGIVLSNKNIKPEDKLKIKFNVFAVINNEINTTAQMIKFMRFKNDFKYIEFLKYKKIDNDFKQIKNMHDEYVSNGYEGIMLRDPSMFYDFKRSNALLKYKNFKEEDFKIKGYFEGEGKYSGMLGGFEICGVVDGHKIKSRVGSGFSDHQRKKFWKEKDELIGKLVEIKFQGITDDKSSLRFPVVKGLKLDR